MVSSCCSLVLVFLALFLLFQPCTSSSSTCTSQILSKNRLFANCTDLPSLSSYLHWTYTPSKSILNLAFIAPPTSPNGWISWAINPIAPKMVGSQALIAYQQDNGLMTVKTFNVSRYSGFGPSPISFEVQEMEAVYANDVLSIFATIVLPKNMGPVLNQVWQVGSSVTNGIPNAHSFKDENLKSMAVLDLTKGETSGAAAVDDKRIKWKLCHGIVNVLAWEFMFPFGLTTARYLSIFQSAIPCWFYIHVFCPVSASLLGLVGGGTGLMLGNESKGVQHTSHRNMGIALIALVALRLLIGFFLRPKKEHKYRKCWKFCHHGFGYDITVLGIVNAYVGLDIFDVAKKWKIAYIVVLAVWGVIIVMLEAVTWKIVLDRKSNNSAKPCDGNEKA
ncbi:hypothetical protein IFM89_035263 [Coptis chinensis]|uniref:Cytochrome b561 and DOMON domain-containing protein n=1 Tax=Coptis chinensis TaxID=261450 RepID=A0A835H4B5_9MAGN|nr:hypothetical protein IFM89_035263 [Coptis chinensis]